MALIKCFECGNEISDTAVSCPKCGISLGGQSAGTTNKKSGGNKVLNILGIIFIALYSIFCIYMVYTNIKNFFNTIDYIEFVDVTYYICWTTYYIGSALALWMMLAYNITNNKIFKILSGGAIAITVFFALVYYLVGIVTWTEDIKSFFDLVGSILQMFFGYYGTLIGSYLLFINRKKC